MVDFDPQIDPALAEPRGLPGVLAGHGNSIARGQPPLPAESQMPEEPLDCSDCDAETACQRRAAVHRRLIAGHAPVGILEETLISELANLTIDLEDYRAALEAARRTATATFSEICGLMARQWPQHRPPTTGSPYGAAAAPDADAVITAASTSKPVRWAEERLAHTRKVFFETLTKLQAMQQRRRLLELHRIAGAPGITIDVVSRPDAPPAITPPLAQAERWDPGPSAETQGRLADLADVEMEAGCEQIFREWVRTARLPCPQCGSQEPALELKTRRVLQCRCCGGQRGLRTGTFLANANISFLAAVRAVRLLALEPEAPLRILCRATGLSSKSMRGLRSRIREVLEDPARRKSLLAACGYQPEQALPT